MAAQPGPRVGALLTAGPWAAGRHPRAAGMHSRPRRSHTAVVDECEGVQSTPRHTSGWLPSVHPRSAPNRPTRRLCLQAANENRVLSILKAAFDQAWDLAKHHRSLAVSCTRAWWTAAPSHVQLRCAVLRCATLCHGGPAASRHGRQGGTGGSALPEMEGTPVRCRARCWRQTSCMWSAPGRGWARLYRSWNARRAPAG